MEWAVLGAFALVAAALIGLSRGGVPASRAADEEATLRAERRRLLDELVEIDEDAAAGRISADDRMAARRSIAPRLRTVTEALQARGVEFRSPAGDEAAR